MSPPLDALSTTGLRCAARATKRQPRPAAQAEGARGSADAAAGGGPARRPRDEAAAVDQQFPRSAAVEERSQGQLRLESSRFRRARAPAMRPSGAESERGLPVAVVRHYDARARVTRGQAALRCAVPRYRAVDCDGCDRVTPRHAASCCSFVCPRVFLRRTSVTIRVGSIAPSTRSFIRSSGELQAQARTRQERARQGGRSLPLRELRQVGTLYFASRERNVTSPCPHLGWGVSPWRPSVASQWADSPIKRNRIMGS